MSMLPKGVLCVVAGCLLEAMSVSAQGIDVRLTLAYNAFVIGEPVLIEVELVNAGRELIDVGGTNSKSVLLIDVTKGSQYNLLEPVNAAPLAGTFQVKSGQTFRHMLELDKWYSMLTEGRYMVQLVLVHNDMRFESTKKSFDVVSGITVLEGTQMFVNRDKMTRRFKLVYWHRNQTDRLFLRTMDEPLQRVWDSVDLGKLMQGDRPKLDISPKGEVTVVQRATQDAFIRTVFWSLPDSLEIVERNNLLDPETSASQRVKSLYGEMADDGAGKKEDKSWWKFW